MCVFACELPRLEGLDWAVSDTVSDESLPIESAIVYPKSSWTLVSEARPSMQRAAIYKSSFATVTQVPKIHSRDLIDTYIHAGSRFDGE